MTTFQPGGPERYAHQRAGLKKMIDTGGVCALLFDPGLGKTGTVVDYCSLLALKATGGEARVLVVAPLAAVDTWVLQMQQFASPQVGYWAEVVGGSLKQRGEALASRGGQPYKDTLDGRTHHRAVGVRRSVLIRTTSGFIAHGPGSMDTDKPRVVMCVTNIDTFSSRHQTGSRTIADFLVDAVRRFDPHLIVVDESHRIKSAQGNASRLLARISQSVPRRVMLTGTVMPHSPLDVFGQWRFLDPYAFGHTDANGVRRKATFGAFRNEYATMGGYMGKQVTGFRNLDDMRAIMSRNAIVARKEDALDLPPTTDVEVPVELTPAEKKAYMEMKSQLAASLGNPAVWATATNRLAQMMRLRQLTSGFIPDDTGVQRQVGTSKINTIRSIVQDNLAGEKRIVVFCLFTHEISMLSKALADSRTEVMTVSGATSTSDRMLMRKRFGSDEDTRIVMVAQIKTMSLAVNELVTASHAVFGSLSQQRDDLIQARDRLNRIGQTRPVTFWYALAPGTVDTVIMQAHRNRTDLEDAMLKHIMETGTPPA